MTELVTALFVFALVKVSFEVLDWLLSDENDKIYRGHLDELVKKLDDYSLYQLAFLLGERIASRLKSISANRFIVVCVLLILFVVLTNYGALLISFSIMARENENFDFPNRSLLHICWALFRELGFTGSQQILWILVGSSFTSVIAFYCSYRLSINTKRTTTGLQLAWLIVKQLGVVFVSGFFIVGFVYLSVWFYDLSSNTETQQYLFTQTVRMLYWREKLLIVVVLVNTIASTFPSVLFLLVLVFLATLKVVPGFVRKAMSFTVYRLTTGNKPVLAQLGTLSGLVAGLISAVIAYRNH